MSQFSASWRVALRAGRRDVLRSKGRSALIMTMVGAPVLLTVMLTSIVASNEISSAEGLRDQLGSAQAAATYVGGRVEQLPDGIDMARYEGGTQWETTDEQAASLAGLVDGRVDVVERGFGTTVVIDGKGYRSESLASTVRAQLPEVFSGWTRDVCLAPRTKLSCHSAWPRRGPLSVPRSRPAGTTPSRWWG
ncbi:hypothetical protein [Aeromicrobium sp. UC242_57]|uniref:hypothetical protein n=1 Tax=Aeromicrobium sp. UC242_57 TaxID=3374624 RepID=UPI0037B16763